MCDLPGGAGPLGARQSRVDPGLLLQATGPYMQAHIPPRLLHQAVGARLSGLLFRRPRPVDCALCQAQIKVADVRGWIAALCQKKTHHGMYSINGHLIDVKLAYNNGRLMHINLMSLSPVTHIQTDSRNFYEKRAVRIVHQDEDGYTTFLEVNETGYIGASSLSFTCHLFWSTAYDHDVVEVPHVMLYGGDRPRGTHDHRVIRMEEETASVRPWAVRRRENFVGSPASGQPAVFGLRTRPQSNITSLLQ